MRPVVGTIKVWDAGVHADTRPQSRQNLTTPPLATGSLELKAEKQSAHSRDINSVAFNHDGTKIVSGSDDQTIKVWGALAFLAVSHDLAPHHALSLGRCLVPGFVG